MISSPSTYLFCYGFNSPKQVSKLLGISEEEVLPKCIACRLKGYRRAFAGHDKDFDLKSVATIVKDPNSHIDSYAFQVDLNMIGNIDEFEEYPKEYDRVSIQLEDINGNLIDAQVYIMNEKDVFEYPSDEYLHGVALTIAAHNYLSDIQTDYENFSIEVYDYVNDKVHGHHKVKLAIEDYPECVQHKIASLHKPE